MVNVLMPRVCHSAGGAQRANFPQKRSMYLPIAARPNCHRLVDHHQHTDRARVRPPRIPRRTPALRPGFLSHGAAMTLPD
jgi:hypothetical protein